MVRWITSTEHVKRRSGKRQVPPGQKLKSSRTATSSRRSRAETNFSSRFS
jgi:hypothetical protein